MNMSVTQFTVAPAMVGRSRSVWREIMDTVIEGPPRTAADEIAEYLERHQYDCRRHYGLSLSGVTCAYKRRENLFDDVRQGKHGAGPTIGASARWSA
jgi:hypothetical protein